MKELNKLIEGIAFPVRYTRVSGKILDADNCHICEVSHRYGELLEHALNNLSVDISEKCRDESGTSLSDKHDNNNCEKCGGIGSVLVPVTDWDSENCDECDGSGLKSNNLQPSGFICKGCDNRVPTEYSLRTEGYCYLCDPNIATKELLADNLQTGKTEVSCSSDHSSQAGKMVDDNLQPKEGEWPVSGEAQLGAWTTEAQKEAAKGRALIDDITPEAQMMRENK